MTNTVTDRSLLNQLHAYVKHFEIPNTREDLVVIASSILTFQQKQGNLAIAPDLVEPLIQKVISQFKAGDAINSIVDSAEENLVRAVNQWKQSLENQVLNTLNLYVQQFKPEYAQPVCPTI